MAGGQGVSLGRGGGSALAGVGQTNACENITFATRAVIMKSNVTRVCSIHAYLDCFSHSNTIVEFTPAQYKTAKIDQIEHTPGPHSTLECVHFAEFVLVHTLIDYLIALQWKCSHLFNIKQQNSANQTDCCRSILKQEMVCSIR